MDASNGPQAPTGPYWVEHAVGITTTALMIEQHSRFPEASFLVVVLATFVTLWLGSVAISRFRSLIDRPKFNVPRRTFAHLTVFPVAFSIMVTSAMTHWPAMVRFGLSRPSFKHIVSQVHRGELMEDSFPRRIGLYHIKFLMLDEFNSANRSGTIGFSTGTVLADPCGLEYDPKNRPSSHYLTTKIAPKWYVTEW